MTVCNWQKAASPQHMDGSIVFAKVRGANVHFHLIHASFGPPESTSHATSWSVQPFFAGSRSWRTYHLPTDRPRYFVCIRIGQSYGVGQVVLTLSLKTEKFTTHLNSTENYGRRCLTPVSPYIIIIYYHKQELIRTWDSERELLRSAPRKLPEFAEIIQNNGYCAVQGHSRSPILVPIESSYTISCDYTNLPYIAPFPRYSRR